MTDFDAEGHVLTVYRDKCRRAGGLKAGFNLRLQSIQYHLSEEQLDACAAAVASLVEGGVLASNELGDRFSLTEDGVATLTD